jgi:hypothetical protein
MRRRQTKAKRKHLFRFGLKTIHRGVRNDEDKIASFCSISINGFDTQVRCGEVEKKIFKFLKGKSST